MLLAATAKFMIKAFANLLITSLLFFPEEAHIATPDQYGLAFEDIHLQTTEGFALHGWFLSASNPTAKTIFFCHGNAGNISGRLGKTAPWVERGWNVLHFDYRSYGKSQGAIASESDLYADAESFMKWLAEEKKIFPKDIVLYGESLGAAVASEFATREAFLGVLLEVPFASLREIAKEHYPWIPTAVIPKHFQFDNIGKAENFKAPLFWIHGTADPVCPYQMGERIFAKAKVQKDKYSIPEGAHSDLHEKGGDDYYDLPDRFFRQF